MIALEGIERVLIKAPNWVGDALMCTPALNSLGRALPRARLTVLAAPWVAPLLETHPAVARVVIYDPRGEHRSWSARRHLLHRLRSLEFELAILFPNSLHAALIAFLSAVPERLGYATDGRGLLLTRSVSLRAESKCIHQAEYYLELLRWGLGMEILPEERRLVLRLEAGERRWARDFLAERRLRLAGRCLIALHPGAVKAGKRWPARRFALLGEELLKRCQAHLLLLGAEGERPLLERISRRVGEDCCTIVCGVALPRVAALIERSRLFIGNDSGLMHVAAAMRTPIVAIFGPGAPQTTAPYGQDLLYSIVMREMDCRPCRQRFFRECRPSPEGAPPCLDALGVREVLAAAEKLLEKAELIRKG